MNYKVTNIKKAKYQKRNDVVKSIEVTFNNSNTVLGVPINTDNDDYVDLMKQVDAGELTIEDAD
jgi:uncharacterized protein YjaZ|tara:strand:+ start:423 stop:614 length:192 start_codon:yes stop_codon:yes gene_type:complete